MIIEFNAINSKIHINIYIETVWANIFQNAHAFMCFLNKNNIIHDVYRPKEIEIADRKRETYINP